MLRRTQVLTIAKEDFLWLLEGTAVRDRLMRLAEVRAERPLRAVEYPRCPLRYPVGPAALPCAHAQAAQVRSFDSHSALMENSRLRLLSETQKTQLEEKLKHQKRRRHWRLAVEAHNTSFSLSPSPYVHESCVACLAR